MNSTWSMASHSPEDTRAFGRRLGAWLHGGETLGLIGPLGAGKTALAQGIAEGMGIPEPLTSPTYLIHRRYDGRLRLHHFDFYRLEGPDDLESVGFCDFQAEGGEAVIVVEWADRFPDALDEPLLEIELRPGPGESDRAIQIRGRGFDPARWRALVGEGSSA